MRKWAFLFLSMLLLIDGCGSGKKPRFTEEELANIPFPQRDGLPECSGGFVLAVGSETITADEMVLSLAPDFKQVARSSTFEQFKERARAQIEQIITVRILNILLYSKAKKQAGEGIGEALEELAEAEVERFFAGFGGDDAKANEALKEKGMNRQSYKGYLKMVILNQSYMASKVPDNKSITYSELLECYNEVKNEFAQQAVIKFWLINIKVAALELTDPNQNRQQQAQKLADELMGRIWAGEDFSRLAEGYSGVSFIDHSDGVRPESLAKPYDILVVEAETIKPGQITGPIKTETGEHIFIMKLQERRLKGFKPLEEVQKQVEEKIIADRRKKAATEIEAELLQQAALDEKDEFVDFCLKKIYRMSNQEGQK